MPLPRPRPSDLGGQPLDLQQFINKNALNGTVDDPSNDSPPQPVWTPLDPIYFADGSTGTISVIQQTADKIFGNLKVSAPGGQVVATYSQDERGYQAILDDRYDSAQLWSSRVVQWSADQDMVADLRDYTAVSDQWLANHTFPTTNLWQADETFATDMSAAVTRDAAHGGAVGDAAPNPIAYERGENSFSLGSFDIDSSFNSEFTSVKLRDPSSFGSSFDTSGYFYFDGSSNWGAFGRVSFATNFFDSSVDGISFSFPVILDLNGDGVRIEPRTGSNVFFNADGDSALERTSWVGTGDGLLVVDLNGDGKIQADEMAFASRTADPNDTDLDAVATLYDSNGDHKLDANDAAWSQLRVWIDPDRDAVTDAGELRTLDSFGITSISLVSDRNAFTLPDGSRINGFSSFEMNGQTRTLADAALAFESEGFIRSTENELTIYTSQDGATVRKYYDVANLDGYGEAGLLIDIPAYGNDGVLGGQYKDVVKLTNVTKPLTLYGAADNDTLWSGSGNDVLDGGTGSDDLRSGFGDDTIYFDYTDLVQAGPGYDTGILTNSLWYYDIRLSDKGLEAFISANGDDNIYADTTGAATYVDGRGGNDKIWAGNFGDMLMGGAGNDELHGNGGNDLLVGGAGNDVILGDDSDDVLIGGAGVDRIDGGNGTDTATFTGAAADFRRIAYNGHIYVFAANGERDDITGVEFLRFDDQTIDANTVSVAPPINGLEYIASYADLITSYRNSPNRAEGGQNHYLNQGIPEGRTVTFDGLAYIASYTDLINDNHANPTDSAGANHFIDFGFGEGRSVSFKPREYIASYADLINAYHGDSDSGARHYIMTGAGEGRTILFKPQSYLDSNPDLKAQFGNDYEAATLHYVQDGYAQGRQWNRAPVVTASNATVAFNKTIAATTLVSATDADGHALAYYFRDDTIGGGSGRFWLDGVAQAEGQEFGVNAAQLGRLEYRSGTSGDHITVHAWDRIASSADVGFQISAVNHAPTTSVTNLTATVNKVFAGPSLVSAADADGDALSYYLRDDTIGNGRFWLDGNALGEQQWIALTAAQFQNLTFKAGTSGADHITTHVWDGAAQSTDAGFDITVANAAPVVTASDTSAGRDKVLIASTLLNASDPNGDSFAYYLRDDTAGGGKFWLDGNALAEQQWIGLTASQFANLQFKTDSSVGTDHITVHLWDGGLQSTDVGFNINTVNNAPVVTASDTSAARGKTLAASSLMSASDADGDAFAYYLRDDTLGGGKFWLDGNALAEQQWIGLTASQFANLQFKTGSSVGTDHITAHLWDGGLQSIDVGFNVNTINNAPVLTAYGDVHASAGQVIQRTSLFSSVGDPDGDDYSIWLRDNTVGGGHFELNGVALPEGSEFGLTSAQYQQLTFRAGPAGSNDHITGHLWDGNKQSVPDVDFHIIV